MRPNRSVVRSEHSSPRGNTSPPMNHPHLSSRGAVESGSRNRQQRAERHKASHHEGMWFLRSNCGDRPRRRMSDTVIFAKRVIFTKSRLRGAGESCLLKSPYLQLIGCARSISYVFSSAFGTSIAVGCCGGVFVAFWGTGDLDLDPNRTA